MIKHELRSCPRCGALTTVKVRRPNHILHAVLSLLTFGLWIPIWLLAMVESAFSRGKVKCKCSTKWVSVGDPRSRHG